MSVILVCQLNSPALFVFLLTSRFYEMCSLNMSKLCSMILQTVFSAMFGQSAR